MQFEIRNRWTEAVQFTAEIEADDRTPLGVKVGLAVRWALKNRANLIGAVLSGAYLSDANLSDANLRGAVLIGAVLIGANLIGANLRGAALIGANLIGADLSGAVLSGAYLSGAYLSDAALIGADLSDAYLSDAGWIPTIPNIHTAVYAAASQDGALDMGDWHADGFCGTTHCRAGWVTHLAGDAGRVMDALMGTPAAAALIYAKSDPTLERVPDFYASNEDALADMKRLAEAEAPT